MKTQIKIFILFFGLTAVTWIAPPKAAAQVSVSFQVFYDDLSPYGSWVQNPDYGYVWYPDVSSGFTPYATNGHWVFTDDGWTWVSNYSWGWAPFHYGRWFYDSYYGWVWVPDNQWGPAWVTWRRSNDYYGWAPIGPGISIDIAFSNSYSLPYDRWTFVRNRDFGNTNINNYYINNSNNVTIINNTTVINNIRQDRTRNVRYNAGPERTEVERVSGRSYKPVAIRETNKPGQRLANNQLEIYRPKVEKPLVIDRKPAPAKVRDIKEVRPTGQRNAGTQPVKNDQPATKPPVQATQPDQKRNIAPVKQPPVQQQKRNEPPVKQPPVQQQKKNEQPVKQPPVQQQKRNEQPVKQPPVQQQKNNEQPMRMPPVENKQPPVQQQKRNEQPAQQQPAKQPPAQQKQNVPPAKQAPEKKKTNNQPNRGSA